MIGLTFVAALIVAFVVRGPGVLGLGVLFLIFVPLEKLFALRPQKVFRRSLVTDLTHFLVNNLLVTAGTVALIVVGAIPLFWVRNFNIQSLLPGGVAGVLAFVLVFVGNYWGHRLTHKIPFLWRFHAVHHSIEQMDWVASARLHPLDSAFTQAFTVLPLFLLGYGGGAFAGVAVFFTLLALFQHANVRLRFPFVRWVINTPEWHHWHHAIDAEATDKNFGLPIVDKIFGTAYLPKDKRPTGLRDSRPGPARRLAPASRVPFLQGGTARRDGAAERPVGRRRVSRRRASATGSWKCCSTA